MAIDQPVCPSCGTPMVHHMEHTIRSECPACGGKLIGLSPFERMLADGVGARVWVASGEFGTAGPPCPFCGNHMREPSADVHVPEGVAVCHTCQQVWLPAASADWVAANSPIGAAAPASAAAPPANCVNCGAPFEPDEMGRCHFCHAEIAAPRVDALWSAASSWDELPPIRLVSLGDHLRSLKNALLE